MKAVISPYFEANRPLRMLHKGQFINHYDVAQRGQQLRLGLQDAGCILETIPPSKLDESNLHELILSIHDAKYIKYLQEAWANWSKIQNSSTEILPNISPNRHMQRFNEENPEAESRLVYW